MDREVKRVYSLSDSKTFIPVGSKKQIAKCNNLASGAHKNCVFIKKIHRLSNMLRHVTVI